jgi:hypothetical protein
VVFACVVFACSVFACRGPEHRAARSDDARRLAAGSASLSAPPARREACEPRVITAAPPLVPEGVILQSIVTSEACDEAGYRIYADGRHESRACGNEKSWKVTTTLSADELSRVREAIARTKIAALARGYGAPRPASDETTSWIQIRGEANHDVAVRGGCRIAALEALGSELLAIFHER